MARKGKIISLVVMSFLPLICCYGCNPASKAETPINSEPYVTVNVEIDTLIPDEGGYIFTSDDNDFSLGLATIELNIMNQLQDEIITSEPYNVQTLKNGAWTDIPLGLAFDLPGLKIAPGSTRVFQCDLHPENYDYIPGEYRILKEISVYKKQYTISIRFKLCE